MITGRPKTACAKESSAHIQAIGITLNRALLNPKHRAIAQQACKLSVQSIFGLEYDRAKSRSINQAPMSRNDNNRTTLKTVLIASALIAAAGLAAYLYDGRKSAEPLQQNAAHRPPSMTKPEPRAALAELFGTAFDNGSIQTKSGEKASLWFEQPFSLGSDRYHVLFSKAQQLDPETGAPLDSHVQGVSVGAITYKLDAQGWRAVGKQTGIGEIGSWGEAPEIERAEILILSPSRIALLIDFGYGMGGYFDEGKVLFGFDGTHWHDLGFVQTGGNNEGACDETPSASGVTIPCWSYTGTISVRPEMHRGYPDVLVERTGTQSGDDRSPVRPATNAVYRFDGEKYADTTAD